MNVNHLSCATVIARRRRRIRFVVAMVIFMTTAISASQLWHIPLWWLFVPALVAASLLVRVGSRRCEPVELRRVRSGCTERQP